VQLAEGMTSLEAKLGPLLTATEPKRRITIYRLMVWRTKPLTPLMRSAVEPELGSVGEAADAIHTAGWVLLGMAALAIVWVYHMHPPLRL
jgi:hypothetical protein